MINNPGVGGGAYFSNNFLIQEKLDPILHDTTINYAELSAIKTVFESILTVYKNTKFVPIKNITIMTDSLFCLNLLSINGYPQYKYYYDLLQIIWTIINNINKICNIKIKICKIKSHSGNYGNDMADILAKQAANIAHKIKFENELNIDKDCREFPNHTYNNNNNSINVDNTIMINKFKEKIKIDNDWYWNDLITQYEFSGLENKYIGKGQFISIFPTTRYGEYIYQKQSNYLIDEYKYLKADEASTINKLRTEHINLNSYKHYYFEKKEVKNKLCQYCISNLNIDTVQHYLFECKKYEKERRRMHKRLRKINKLFKNRKNLTFKNILFPHTWQNKLDQNDENYKYKKYENINVRIEIFKTVKKFVEDTQRFNGDYGE